MYIRQFDPIDRDGIEAPAATVNKDGQYQCKKHGSTGVCPSPLARSIADYCIWNAGCNQCFGWKKQITRARTAAKKAGKK